ncbi:MAG: carbohydrate ABC transporter substrate-binding protein, partial [Gammaproteobacteria bacterium]|nr:carbohydrate ABC transporter substrate-binding protein [Gammaproteobacteria bacterium]
MKSKLAFAVSTALTFMAQGVYAGTAEAEKWINDEFQPSTLSKEEQMAELEWFIKAAEPFKGMEINVLSETIPTHEYESKTLTKAFEE